MNEKGFEFGFNDVVTNIDIDLYKELAALGCKEAMLNFLGQKSPSYVDSMRAKIEEETGIKVILRKENKYFVNKDSKK
jgi:hypothetical protein